MISSVNRENLYWLNQSNSQFGSNGILSKLIASKSGSLSASELGTLVTNISQMTGRMMDPDTILSLLNSNQNGTTGSTQSQYGSPKPEDIFNMLDENQDGSLDSTEVSAFASQLSEMFGTTVDGATLLKTLDSDNDGIINETELKDGEENVETLFGLPAQYDQAQTKTSEIMNLLSSLMNTSRTNTSWNSADNTTNYQSLSNLYATGLASLLGKINISV